MKQGKQAAAGPGEDRAGGLFLGNRDTQIAKIVGCADAGGASLAEFAMRLPFLPADCANDALRSSAHPTG